MPSTIRASCRSSFCHPQPPGGGSGIALAHCAWVARCVGLAASRRLELARLAHRATARKRRSSRAASSPAISPAAWPSRLTERSLIRSMWCARGHTARARRCPDGDRRVLRPGCLAGLRRAGHADPGRGSGTGRGAQAEQPLRPAALRAGGSVRGDCARTGVAAPAIEIAGHGRCQQPPADLDDDDRRRQAPDRDRQEEGQQR